MCVSVCLSLVLIGQAISAWKRGGVCVCVCVCVHYVCVCSVSVYMHVCLCMSEWVCEFVQMCVCKWWGSSEQSSVWYVTTLHWVILCLSPPFQWVSTAVLSWMSMASLSARHEPFPLPWTTPLLLPHGTR